MCSKANTDSLKVNPYIKDLERIVTIKNEALVRMKTDTKVTASLFIEIIIHRNL